VLRGRVAVSDEPYYRDGEGIMLGLTKRQVLFSHKVAENPKWSATKCAIEAGYSEVSAAEIASNNIRKVEIQEAIQDRRDQLAAASGLTPELILREMMQIAFADPSELVRVVVTPCSLCWAIPGDELPPNPACTTCKGEGLSFVRVADTRKLKGAAKRLYSGAHQTKDGIKIQMRDQDAALKYLADYLGMLNKSKGEISGPGGGAIPIANATVQDLTDEQLMLIAGTALLPESVNLGVSSGVYEGGVAEGVTIEGS
jgi:phage terminase small subunit